MIDTNFITKNSLKIAEKNRNCSFGRREFGIRAYLPLSLFGFSISPSRDLRGSRRPVGATRLPCAISPSTFFFALLSSLSAFSLSLSRSLCAFRSTRRPTQTRTSAVRLTVEEMRTRGEAQIDPRNDFSDLAMIYYAHSQHHEECIILNEAELESIL